MNTMSAQIKKGAPQNNMKCCKCLIHESITCGAKPSRVFKVSSKDYPKKSLKYLIEKKLFGKYAKYVCNVCIDYGLEKLSNARDIGKDENSVVMLDNNGDMTFSGEGDAVDVVVEASGDKTQSVLDAADLLIGYLNSVEAEDDDVKGKMSSLAYLLGKIVRTSVTRHCKDLQMMRT